MMLKNVLKEQLFYSREDNNKNGTLLCGRLKMMRRREKSYNSVIWSDLNKRTSCSCH